MTTVTTGCEVHEAPGACTEECVILAYQTLGPGPESFYDPTGCHAPKPMPEHVPVLDVEARVVKWIDVHPEDCQCGADDCPLIVAERDWNALANVYPTTLRDGTPVTIYAWPDGGVVESTTNPFYGPVIAMHGRMLPL